MKKKDIELIFKGADEQSWKELLDDLRPKGKWKEHKLRNDIVVEYVFKCSNCKRDSGLLYRTDFCPNCGGYLNDAGRCEFCGSKVFDFLTISFDRMEMPSAKTYIRLKVGNQVVIAPVIINTAKIESRPNSMLECANLMEGTRYIFAPCYPEINLELMVIGDMIQIDEEGDTD